MADWAVGASPVTTDNYSSTVLPAIKNRDFDAISLGYGGLVTNPVVGIIRLLRSGTNDVNLQEWQGASYVNKVLALINGGTGAGNAADARANLGIGTLGIQASNSVSITGGNISGLGSLGVNGAATITGTLTLGSTPVVLTDATGKINGISSAYFANLSGANLTNLNASALASGTIPDARFPVVLPTLSGVNLTNLNATNLASGTVNVARLGTGATATKFLRGDNTWQEVSLVLSVQALDIDTTFNSNAAGQADVTLGTTLTDWTKAVIADHSMTSYSSSTMEAYPQIRLKIINNTTLRYFWDDTDSGTIVFKTTIYIVEYKIP